MHRKHCLTPILRSAPAQTRSGATASNAQPRDWSNLNSGSPGVAKPQSSLPSRKTWAAPDHVAAKARAAVQNKWSRPSPLSSQSEGAPSQPPKNKWARPSHLPSKSEGTLPQSPRARQPHFSVRPSQSATSSTGELSQGLRHPRQELYRNPPGRYSFQNPNISQASRTPAQDAKSSSPQYLRTKTSPDATPITYPPGMASDSKNQPMRQKRNNFKERGSLLSDTLHGSDLSGRLAEGRLQQQKVTNSTIKKVKELTKRIDVYIPSVVSVGRLAKLLKVRLEQLQSVMRKSGMGEEASYDYVLTSDYASLLAEEFNRNPIVNDDATFDLLPPQKHPDPTSLPVRPPVVTIMGHVDHGKTTLLDTLRSSAVAKGEAGGITQHIGAFSVPVPAAESSSSNVQSSTVTFLDTPGHAAFAAMRARGASVTDIIVLVVAADDGIMPQTREVINLVKSDNGIGLVIAINKIDKPGANIESVERALLAEGIQLETFGGDIPCVHVSGLTGQGLPDLLETISTIAEIQDLRAEREGRAYGCVLESKIEKGLGSVATVLVRQGCLQPGAHILSGTSQSKVRIMTDSNGKITKAAYPGTAVIVSGWKSLPKAGDDVFQGTENEVKKALANRIRQDEIEASLADLDAINASRRQDREIREQEKVQSSAKVEVVEDISMGPKQLRLIIKADVSGSAEAVEGALQGMGNEHAMTKIIHTGVGNVSESDVMLAKAAGATIVAFSVTAPRSVEAIATQNGVPICSSPIIYKLMELVREKVIELLPVIVKTNIAAEAKVLQIFDIQLKNKQTQTVAGCRVTDGIIQKGKAARVIRDTVVIHEGRLDTLRYLKDNVSEVRKGSECGLTFTEAVQLKEGDIIQTIDTIELPGVL